MATELKPPVIEMALCILGKTIEIPHVNAQNMEVQIILLNPIIN